MNGEDRNGELQAAAEAEQQQVNAEEWLSGLEEREERVAHREQVASERNALADERERAADERERIADERERLADEREAYADERERRLNDVESRVDARARTFGMPTETVPERALEAIARGRALLAASGANLDRSEAAIQRQRDRNDRGPQSVNREVAATERDVESTPPDQATPSRLADQTSLLRQRFLAAAADLVRVEEHIAETYERSRDTDPDRKARHLRIAEEAREAARHARIAAVHLEEPRQNVV